MPSLKPEKNAGYPVYHPIIPLFRDPSLATQDPAKRAMHAALAVSLGALVASQHPMNGKVPGMVNSGTPGGVPAGYDCAVREHAW